MHLICLSIIVFLVASSECERRKPAHRPFGKGFFGYPRSFGEEMYYLLRTHREFLAGEAGTYTLYTLLDLYYRWDRRSYDALRAIDQSVIAIYEKTFPPTPLGVWNASAL